MHVSPRRLRLLLSGALCLLIGGLYCPPLRTAAVVGSQFDDAYMFLRYADNLLRGAGFAWNPGAAPIHGPTSVPYVFVMALFRRLLPLPPGFLVALVSWLLGAAMLAALCWIALRRLRGSPTPALALALGCLAYMVALPGLNYHAISGMDTTLSMLMNTLLVGGWFALPPDRPRRRAALLAALAYLSYAVRPDNGLYALGFPLLALGLERRPGSRRAALLFGALFAGLVALDTVAKLLVFNDPLPLSFYVKRSGFYDDYAGRASWNASLYLSYLLLVTLPMLVAIGLRARRRHLPFLLACLLPVAATSAYYFSVVQIMGYLARYYYPAIPLIFAAALAVLADRDAADPPLSLRRGLLAPLAILGLLIGFREPGSLLYVAAFGDIERPHVPEGPNWPVIQIVSPIVSQLPAGSVVAASEVGYVSAAAPDAAIIDIVGLNDREIAHNGFQAAAFLRRRPDLIWMPHPDYVQIVRSLECDPAFRRDYRYYPGLFLYGVAVLADGPHATEIQAALEQGVSQAYGQLDLAAVAASAAPSCDS